MPNIVTPRIAGDTELYSKRYEKFRGVDFSTDPAQVHDTRSPLCANLIADLAGFPEKRTGWRTLQSIDAPVNRLFYVVFASGATAFLAHVGTKLYKWAETGEPVVIYTEMNNAHSTAFAHKGKLYILDGAHYLVCSESAGTITAAKVTAGACFIPTTIIGAPAAGGGTAFEGVNLLCSKRKNSMIGDGKSIKFYLDSKSVEAVDSVKVEGVDYTVTASPWAREAPASFLVPAVPAGTSFKLKAGGRTYLVVDASGVAIVPSTLTAGNRTTHLLTGVKDGEFYLAKPYTYDAATVPTVTAKLAESTFELTSTVLNLSEVTVSFLVPAVPTGTSYYLKAGGRTYLVVNAAGTAISPSTLTVGSRSAHILTATKDATNEYYLAKPYTYNSAGTPNAPTLTATLNTSTFELSSTVYAPNLAEGMIEFALPPTAYTGGSGVDNVIIQFAKAIAGYADKIEKCTIAAFYGFNNDNRIFVAGNPAEKNIDYQSGLDDPTYFPDTGFTKIGADTSAIMGYLKQHNTLAVIKSDNQQDAEIFLRTAEMMESGKSLFPVVQGVKGIGAVSKYAFGSLRDDPLFLAREGVYALASTAATQERVLQDRSFFVNSKLTKETGLENAVGVVWNGLYVLCVNGNCYVADSRQKTGNSKTEQYGYEWYYWTNIPARTFLEHEGALYFGTEDGRICKLNTDINTMARYNDDGVPIKARWATKADDFGTIMRRKTLVKKGCGMMIKPYARSSVKVYAATEAQHEYLIKHSFMDILTFADIDFERITFNTMDVPQVKAFNKKIKKFITLQLIFENDALNEGFGVYGAQVQYAIGNYVK